MIDIFKQIFNLFQLIHFISFHQSKVQTYLSNSFFIRLIFLKIQKMTPYKQLLGKRVGYFLQLYIKETCILNFARSNCGGIYVYSVVQNQDLCKWRTWTRSMPFLRSIFHTICLKIQQTFLFLFLLIYQYFLLGIRQWKDTLRFRSISLKLKSLHDSLRLTRLFQFFTIETGYISLVD